MPVLSCDPWREQFFGGCQCPADVSVPLKDPDAYHMFPAHNWVYNKLAVAERQGLACGPDGTQPETYPVFCKPIYNLRSMGIDSGRIESSAVLSDVLQPGFMWCELLEGAFYSTDIAVIDGTPVWMCHTQGFPTRDGMFDHWVIQPGPRANLGPYLTDFVTAHFQGYTGMMNFETIGGRIIEGHLRFADQWVDLYGQGFVSAVYGLYAGRGWAGGATPDRAGYSVPLFVDPDRYQQHDSETLAQMIREDDISSIQLSFHEGRAPESHAMPPGGMRAAIVNGHDREACCRVRNALAAFFDAQHPAQKLRQVR